LRIHPTSLFLANQDGHRLPVALATLREPIAKSRREAIGLYPVAGFHPAITERQSVVKFGRTGEIAHGKGIEPLKRTWPRLVAYNGINAKFPCIHRRSITFGRAIAGARHLAFQRGVA
jgi:hypothetical protein